ncbi:MAG: hypothetical protein U0610_13735 [bacterium]
MRKLTMPFAISLAAALVLALTLGSSGCGRTLSRWGLGAQKLHAPDGAQQVLGISFHQEGTSTIKDVVFVMDDCTIIAREYKDISPFEGKLEILDHDGKPFRQAGCVPRVASK